MTYFIFNEPVWCVHKYYIKEIYFVAFHQITRNIIFIKSQLNVNDISPENLAF